jgi:hypothetical protein
MLNKIQTVSIDTEDVDLFNKYRLHRYACVPIHILYPIGRMYDGDFIYDIQLYASPAKMWTITVRLNNDKKEAITVYHFGPGPLSRYLGSIIMLANGLIIAEWLRE